MASPPPRRPGANFGFHKLVAQEYKPIRLVGEGGFGKVYAVREAASGKLRVCKVTKLQGLDLTRDRRYCSSETRALHLLRIASDSQHRNIIGHYEDFVARSTKIAYHIFEYANAGDLADLMDNHEQRRVKIPSAFLWHTLIQLSDALAYVHHGVGATAATPTLPTAGWRTVLHMDLKPANILLRWPRGSHRQRDYPQLVLADFGCALLPSDPDFDPFSFAGTRNYFPPEYRASPGSDVWALGLVLHEMATFRLFAARIPDRIGLRGRQVPHRCYATEELGRCSNRTGCRAGTETVRAGYSAQLAAWVGMMLHADPRRRLLSRAVAEGMRGEGRRARDTSWKALAGWAFQVSDLAD